MVEVEHKYIYPGWLARKMAKVDLRTQYEASMMSMSLIMVGLVITIVYLFLYASFPTWYKIVLVINGLAGMVFIWSYLITTYQSYKSYMEIQEIEKQLKGGNEKNAEEN